MVVFGKILLLVVVLCSAEGVTAVDDEVVNVVGITVVVNFVVVGTVVVVVVVGNWQSGELVV